METVAPAVVEEVVAPAVAEVETGPVVEEVVDNTLPSDKAEFEMPEKFAGKSAEDIAKAYTELERLKAAPVVETPAGDPAPVDEGVDYVKEFLASGELSEESYTALEAEGIDRKTVDDRLEYEAYKSKKSVDELVEVIGGIDEFTAMDEWSKEAFTPEVLANYSEELAKASKFGKQAILKDVYSQYTAAKGTETAPTGDVVHTNEGQGIATKGYTSQHELQADMADRRYGTDRSYTAAVEAKLAKSKDF